MNLDELTKKLCAERFKYRFVTCPKCRAKSQPYFYFINIRHPVFAALWREDREKRRMSNYPASDEERIRFELGLLSDETLRRVEAEAEKEENVEG